MADRTRWIAHVDMDCFYVSVERLLDPSLIGRPVAVGGTGPRAVISSASYEARKFGVHSAMAGRQALQLCPQLKVVRPKFSEYSQRSRAIFAELKTVAPVVEQVSIDEAYLDFTGCENLYSSREESGRLVKSAIVRCSFLPATVGIATSKLLAKIASDLGKPDGLLVIPPGCEENFMRPLSLGKIPGVGKKTLPIYENAGLRTCGDLLDRSDSWLTERFGRNILELKERARGRDDREVSDEPGTAKSIGKEETFEKNVSDRSELEFTLRSIAEEIATDLRDQGLKAKTIQIKCRYPDFATITRAKTLSESTFFSRVIAETAIELFRANIAKGIALRLVGVSCKNFVPAVQPEAQLDFFSTQIVQREEKVEHLKDLLREKFGKNILLKPR